MQITRIYSGDDGQSHFEDIDIDLISGAAGLISAPWPAHSVLFREVDGDYALDFHTAPRRQLVVNLSGEVDIETGDGTVRRFGPGDILLAEDTHGQGHLSRAVAGQARQCLFIPLAD